MKIKRFGKEIEINFSCSLYHYEKPEMIMDFEFKFEGETFEKRLFINRMTKNHILRFINHTIDLIIPPPPEQRILNEAEKIKDEIIEELKKQYKCED